MKDTESTSTSTSAGTEMGNIYISSEQIIQEVQKFRCLYDPADPDHKDRDVMRDAWLTVTQAVVGEPWAKLNNAEKNEAVRELRRRWRNLRDNMRKSVKGNSSVRDTRASCKKSRPYLYYDQLTFLLETESFKEINDAEVDKPTPQKIKKFRMSKPRPLRMLRPKKKRRITRTSNDKDDTSATHETDELSETSDSHQSTGSPRSKLKTNKPPPIIHTMKRENICETEQSPVIVSYNSCSLEDTFSEREHLSSAASQEICMPDLRNPDWCFMLSLLPRVGALRSRDKLDFQIKVMELLRGYEVDDSS